MMEMPSKKTLLNAGITSASSEEVMDAVLQLARQRCSSYVCVANVHMAVEAYYDAAFSQILREADIAIPDGKPLAISMNLLYGGNQQRVAGPDFMLALFSRAEQEAIPVYFLGSTDEVLSAMQKKLAADYPRLQVAGMHSPPFRPLSREEDEQIVAEIINSGAGIVLVALGCPKQERWMAAQRGRIPAVMLGIGAAFPFYTGHLSRAPLWMQNFCLEWLYRLLMEPRRLFKRYLVTNTVFLFLISLKLLQRQVSQLRSCRSHANPEQPRIAVVNPGAGLGDHVMALPAIQAIRNTIPDALIDLAANEKTAVIAQLLPVIDNFVPIAQEGPVQKLRALVSFCRTRNYDLVFYLGKSPVVPLLYFLLTGKKVCGYDTSFLSRPFLQTALPLSMERYLPEQHLNLACDMLASHGYEVKQPDDALPNLRAGVHSAFSDLPLASGMKIMIHPGVSLASQKKRFLKAWPAASWVNLIEAILLREPQATVYLMGGPDDCEVISHISQALDGSANQDRVVNCLGQTRSLPELVALINQADVLISVDSFPMHLAVGLKKPLVGIFASTNEKCYLPEGPMIRVASRQDLACRPCLWNRRKRSCSNPVCLDVPVGTVLEKLEQLLISIKGVSVSVAVDVQAS